MTPITSARSGAISLRVLAKIDGGLLVVPDATTTVNRARIVALAARLRVPVLARADEVIE